jgi:hypothetical protein
MRIRPNSQFDEYEPFGKVYIRNPLQAARYEAHGAKLYDLMRDGDCWLWVFDSREIREKGLFDAWCKHELL